VDGIGNGLRILGGFDSLAFALAFAVEAAAPASGSITSTIEPMRLNSIANMGTAKIIPAEAITPVERIVRMTPDRIPSGGSSRIREINNML
jgi:hypothetical protein